MSKLSTRNWIGAAAVVILVLGALALLYPAWVKANPSQTPPIKTTGNVASSTLTAFLSPGIGTSTLIYDSFSVGSGDVKFDKITIAIQVTGTSTGVKFPTLRFRVEDSYDCIDYYPRSNVLNSVATTSVISGDFADYQLQIASSSLTDLGGSGTATRSYNSFTVDTPMRCTRVKFYSPVGGGTYGLWAALVPIKEKQ